VDFSEFSSRAIPYAVSLARRFGGRVSLQHTVPPPNYLFTEGQGRDSAAVQRDIENEMQRSREEIRALLLSFGIETAEVTVHVNEGNPGEHILKAITEDQIDLVVMGTHGHKGFNRLVLGSLTEELIHRLPCPVLAVSRHLTELVDPLAGVRMRTILLATDFSTHSDRALAYALNWASAWNSKIVLLHVVKEVSSAMKGIIELFPEYNPYFQQQISRAWEAVREYVPDGGQQKCEVYYEIRQGNPKEEILRVAETKDADLIVTGARGAGKSGSLWGSVSSAVVRDGRHPVLVVRELT
jgi:nucleotide-binding universal stress UspA family protein